MASDKTPGSPPAQNEERLFEEFPVPTYDQWRSEVERLLKGVPFEKKMFTRTPEGITLQPIYRREDIRDLAAVHSMPGSAPFIRGHRAIGAKGRSWEVAQEIAYPTYEEFNSALKHDLTRGLTAVVLPLDDASRAGLDPDRAKTGQVGHGGVSISSLIGLTKALDGVNLSQIPVFLQAGCSGLAYLGLYIALAQRSGVALSDLRGAVATDPLGELIGTGTLPAAPEIIYREMAEMTAWAADNAPQMGTIWVHAEPYNDGGGNAVQELACALATAVEYIREMDKRDLTADKTVPRMRFSFAQGNSFFMEVSKLRAARLLWNRVCESCGLPEDKRDMWIHVRTSRYTKTTYDPYVNMLRLTTEAFSGVIGGADSLNVAAFDEHMRPADEFARRIARNTQLIIKDEAHMGRIIDPAGGCWCVERLTAELASAAWKLFQEIEKKGGMGRALADGFVQQSVAATAESRADALASRKRIMVGTNQFPNPSEQPLELRPIDYTAVHTRRSRRLQELRTSPSHQEQVTVLEKLKTLVDAAPAAVTSAVIDAAAHGATVGEITRTLRPEKGDIPKVEPIPARRATEPFERLRHAVEKQRSEKGNMKAYLATLGPVAGYMPRLDFSASFFEVGGFEVIRTSGHDSAETAAAKALESGAEIVVICGQDDAYTDGAPTVATQVKKTNPNAVVVLAGYPREEELVQRFQQAGVDIFIHIKSNALQVLSDLAVKLGVQL